MIEMFPDKRFLVLVGNYGSGKTEISLNLALGYHGSQKTLVDLDIVNPYFRSSGKTEELENAGVRVVKPCFALSNVDIPSLPAEIQSVFEQTAGRVVFDVGGDDTGAAALGRYFPYFQKVRDKTAVLFVVNCMRPLTGTPEDIVDLYERICERSRLRPDVIVNNTNLADKTEPNMLEEGERITLETARRVEVSTVVTVGCPEILSRTRLIGKSMPMTRYMKPEWMVDE